LAAVVAELEKLVALVALVVTLREQQLYPQLKQLLLVLVVHKDPQQATVTAQTTKVQTALIVLLLV
jgi:hypothetical protein